MHILKQTFSEFLLKIRQSAINQIVLIKLNSFITTQDMPRQGNQHGR